MTPEQRASVIRLLKELENARLELENLCGEIKDDTEDTDGNDQAAEAEDITYHIQDEIGQIADAFGIQEGELI